METSLRRQASRAKNALRNIHSALWFRPAASCALALVVACVLAAVDLVLARSDLARALRVSPEFVAGLLETLAGGMLTVTTVTLSVLTLVLSIASGQASPRAVPAIMGDPITQNALSTFLATFVFAIAARSLIGLDAIRGAGVSVTFAAALLLALLSLAYLVRWIHHIADALKVNKVVARIEREAARVLENHLRYDDGPRTRMRGRTGAARDLSSLDTGYVQFVDVDRLSELAEAGDLHVSLAVREGSFVHPGNRLMTVWGADDPGEGTAAALVDAIVVGSERTMPGDPLLGFDLLAEIACRALSPGVNDPQTALICLDYLSALLARAASVPPDEYPRTLAENGRISTVPAAFPEMLRRAIRPVARDASGSAEVIGRIVAVLAELSRLSAPDYLADIIEEARRADGLGRQALALDADRESLAASVAIVERMVEDRSPGTMTRDA